jgi:hypothetical protein
MTASRVLVAILLATTAAAADELPSQDPKPDWGFGFKVRRAWVPTSIQKVLLDDTPGGATMDGAGFDFSRRKDNTEVVFGFGYDRFVGTEGYYLEKDGNAVAGPGDVDYVTFHNPHWYTLEVGVVNHASLHKFLELRYGAGIGIGLVRGEIRKTDSICVSENIQQDCTPNPLGAEVDKPADIPPVLPVVNVLLGLQFKPFKFLHIHVDGGLHTVPYVTAGVSLYLW